MLGVEGLLGGVPQGSGYNVWDVEVHVVVPHLDVDRARAREGLGLGLGLGRILLYIP